MVSTAALTDNGTCAASRERGLFLSSFATRTVCVEIACVISPLPLAAGQRKNQGMEMDAPHA